MSLGVTLTAASRIVILEPDWTPAVNEQAEGRCYRIGQRSGVLAQYLVVPGSIDMSVMRTVAAKLEVISPHSSHAISFDVSRKVSEPVKSVGAGLFGL